MLAKPYSKLTVLTGYSLHVSSWQYISASLRSCTYQFKRKSTSGGFFDKCVALSISKVTIMRFWMLDKSLTLWNY